MKVAIIGGRDFDNFELMKHTINQFVNIDLIISGGARGADTLAEKYAEKRGVETLIHYADWDEHGKAAGIIRNADIVADADLVVAFWDKSSRGTRDSISRCYNTNTPIMIVFYE